MERNQALRALHNRAVIAHGQTHALERIQHAALAIGLARPLLHFAFAISKKAQWPLLGNGRVQLTQSACCRIAWIDKGFFVLFTLGDFLALLFIECLEVITPHVHLAAYFQHGRRIGCVQLQRNLPNGADVLRDIFPRFAIPTRGCLYQHAVFIAQAHGQAVKLQLGVV